MIETSNDVSEAEAPMELDEMRALARRFVPFRRRFDELLQLQQVAVIARKSDVSEQRIWRYKRGEVLWLSIPEYLKMFAVITLTPVPTIMDDPVKAAEHRPRKIGPGRHQPNPKKPKKEPEPEPFAHATLE